MLDKPRDRKRKKNTIYSHTLADRIDAQIPGLILSAMNRLGWSALGIYEIVRDEIRIEKRRKLEEVGDAKP